MRLTPAFILAFVFLLIFRNGYSQQSATPGGVVGVKAWYKTILFANGLLDSITWKDYSGNKIPLLKGTGRYNVLRTGTGGGYRNINFNPSLYFASADLKQIYVDAALSQATYIGVFLSDPAQYNSDQNLFITNARKNEGFLFKSGAVINSDSSKKGILDYGSTAGTDFLFSGSGERETSAAEYVEQSLRTATYYRYNVPAPYSIWGEDMATNISIGSTFSATDPSTTSTYRNTAFANQFFTGYIPEFIVYDRVLTPGERLRVESYLSIKYGITQFVNSYVNSSGDTLWSLDKNAGYNKRITALGRDDADSLLQWRSATSYEEQPYPSFTNDSYFSSYMPVPSVPARKDSATQNRLLSIQMDSVKTQSPKQVLDDKEFMFWGDNDSAIVTATVSQLPGLKIMKRKWKMVRTTPGVSSATWVELSPTVTQGDFVTAGTRPNRKTYLIIDSAGHDGTFKTTSLQYIPTRRYSSVRNQILWDSIIFPGYSGGNTDYFTFGYSEGLFLQLDSINPTCNGATPILRKDTIRIKIREGTAPFTYTVTNSSNVIIATGVTTKQDTVLSNLATGKYSIAVSDKSIPVQNITGTIGLTANCIAPPPADAITLSATPNPNTGLFVLRITLLNPANGKIEISDVGGSVLQTIPFAGPNTLYTQTIDLSALTAGVYFAKVTTTTGFIKTIIVVKL